MTTTTKQSAPVSLRLSPVLASWLEGRASRAMTGRGGLSGRARTELGLWRDVLTVELARQAWTLDELGMIADILSGTVTPGTVSRPGTVAVEVMDATADRTGIYGAKWGVDEADLIRKLRDLGPAADIALADAVARWWTGHHEHTADGWAAVGLVVAG